MANRLASNLDAIKTLSMSKTRTMTLAVVFACAIIAHASPRFATKRLAAISSAVGLQLPDSIAAGTENDSTWTYAGRRLRVCANAFGDISHVGYRLFDPLVLKTHKQKELLFFLERYALELDLRLDKRDAASRMEVDKVVCTTKNIRLLSKVTPQCPPSFEELKETVGRMHRVTWTVEQKRLSLSFPADYQLIAGANDIELEDMFERNLKRIVPITGEDAIQSWSDAKTSHADGYLIVQGGEYLNPAIRGDLYLTEKNGQRRLIVDSRKPVISVTNILLTGLSDHEIPLRLTVNRYGGKHTVADVTIQQFIGLCQMEGCKLYVGVKTHSEKEITATLFALNADMAYNHMMAVNVPLDMLLEKSNAVIQGTVYTYIPLQNVTEKFFTKDLIPTLK